jgi:triosephosphate isomerase
MKLIVGNWKMYPKTFAEAKGIFVTLKSTAKKTKHVKVVICPPHLFVHSIIAARGKSPLNISVGAQNSFWEDEGARTGETSPATLASLGATHVILGHSERRALGETDMMVAQKSIQAIRNKLTVIMCVGEHSRDDAGAYFAEVREQLRRSLLNFPKTESKRLVIAYEPIWAIGAKAVRPATPPDFHEMSILIRRHLVEQFGKAAGFKVPILYGGSVDERNALSFLRDAGADGLLVGRVSLDAQKFGTIIQLADSIK